LISNKTPHNRVTLTHRKGRHVNKTNYTFNDRPTWHRSTTTETVPCSTYSGCITI